MVTNTTLRQVVGCLVLVCVGIFAAPYASAAESNGEAIHNWHALHRLKKTPKVPLEQIKDLIADYEAKRYAHEMKLYVDRCFEAGKVQPMSKAQKKLLQAEYQWDEFPLVLANNLVHFVQKRLVPGEHEEWTNFFYMALLEAAYGLRKRMWIRGDSQNCVDNAPLVKDYMILVLNHIMETLKDSLRGVSYEKQCIARNNLLRMRTWFQTAPKHNYLQDECITVFNQTIAALNRWIKRNLPAGPGE